MKSLILLMLLFVLSSIAIAQTNREDTSFIDKKEKSHIHKNGFYYFDISYLSNNTTGQGFIQRVGSKWFFGENKTYKAGLLFNWIAFNSATSATNQIEKNETKQYWVDITLPTVGFTNAIAFNKGFGVEMNWSGAMAYSADFKGLNLIEQTDLWAINLNHSIIFRFKKFALGIDYNNKILCKKKNYITKPFSQIGLLFEMILES